MNYKRLVVFVFLEIIFSSICIAEEALRTISNPHWVNAATFNNDGKQLISRGKNLIVFDAITGNIIKSILTRSYTVSRNGEYFVKGGKGGILEIRRIDTEKIVNTFPGFSDRKYSKKEIDGFIHRIDNPERWIERLTFTKSVAITPDGQYVAACSFSEFMLRLWDVKSGTLIKELDMRTHERLVNRCEKIFPSLGGKYFAVKDSTRLTYLLNAKTGEVLKTFSSRYNVAAIAFGNNEKNIAIADEMGGINLWNIKQNKIILTIESNQGIRDVSLSSNGKYLAFIASLQNINLWNVETGKLIKTFEGHTDQVNAISFSLDDKFIVSAGFDEKIKVWDVAGDLVAQKNKNTRLRGIVYKSKHFWLDFIDFNTAQNTFNGDFAGLTNNIEFMLHYGNFQSVYYNTCKANLPPNSVLRGYSSQVVVSDGWGNEKYRERSVEHKVYIDPRC